LMLVLASIVNLFRGHLLSDPENRIFLCLRERRGREPTKTDLVEGCG
jgi:hypothetical protein